MAGHTQEPVTFEDVAVYLSRAEWEAIAVRQRDLYCSVMLDNYKLLTSLGYPGPKPDILYRIEHGEEPWLCMPHSPVMWDGPDCPSPGYGRDVSWLEEPPLGWWPCAGERCMQEEKTQTPFQVRPLSPCPATMPPPGRRQTLPNPVSAGGWCMQWCLQSSRLLNKFRCLAGQSESLSEAAGRGAGPVESGKKAQTALCPGERGEDEKEVTASTTQSRGFPLQPVTEQQNKKAHPWEHLDGEPRERFQRSGPKSQRALGKVTFLQGNRKLSVKELNEIILKDHCYCVRETWLLHCASQLCPVREHNYCRSHEVGVSVFKGHQNHHVQGIAYQGRVKKIDRLTGKARVMLHRLEKRRTQTERIIRKANRILWHYKSFDSKRLKLPQGSSSPACPPEPAAPPAKAEDNPAKGTCEAFCSPANQKAVSPKHQSEGSSLGLSPEALGALAVSFEPPPSNAAAEVKSKVTQPKVPVHHEVQSTLQVQSPCTKQNIEECEVVNSNYVSLRDAHKLLMQTVDRLLDSVHQNFELHGCSQCKDRWPIIIQIDS
ncbi:uncharacterized protein LOC130147198 isoform X1 [Falco biarmicus]|uniref:uncharacterized protein LOC130147198 isoform X1 n=2 Tax=Falco biarmicus TaxID=345155 RepID=UPI0024BC3367|nr:uncharacterized protein LOC130147198 isoform X1 [Falco biarmicus]